MEKVSTRLEEVRARLEKVSTRLEKARARLEKVSTRLEKVRARLEKVRARLEKVWTRLEKVWTRLEKVSTRLGKVWTRLEKVSTRLEKVSTRSWKAKTRLEKVSTRSWKVRTGSGERAGGSFGPEPEPSSERYPDPHVTRELADPGGQAEAVDHRHAHRSARHLTCSCQAVDAIGAGDSQSGWSMGRSPARGCRGHPGRVRFSLAASRGETARRPLPFDTRNGMRYSDPIVDEVRAARDSISKECAYDVEKLAQSLKAREAVSGRKVVRLLPRKVSVAQKATG
ncbi:hypothetical protein [Polyangium aurulentum]|uniref:hypothetical protein n=1 Tax=Polyangium aurulentum TaxID=2567896 RepID=UPI00146C658F|nr:hypothetical protein [Polyangium aurulentum]UQA59104.1 hypothetical protein E8A73_000885 [Polyangium aurulentum]